MRYITYYQIRWLNENGGRTAEDVQVDDDDRLFVFMGTKGFGVKKVFLPDNDELFMAYEEHGAKRFTV